MSAGCPLFYLLFDNLSFSYVDYSDMVKGPYVGGISRTIYNIHEQFAFILSQLDSGDRS